MESQTLDAAKRRAAGAALKLVTPGMRLGLGTGSTAAHFIDLLGEKVAQGLDVLCVPTSERTRAQAQSLAIPLADFEMLNELDMTVDGTDEFDPQLRLIKGGGGALWREKIVAFASKRMIVIADSSKAVSQLGKFPLPIEISRFGREATRIAIMRAAVACQLSGTVTLRTDQAGKAVLTDSGNYLIDCAFGVIPNPEKLSAWLNAIPGVIEHGLFIAMADAVIAGSGDGIEIFGQLD